MKGITELSTHSACHHIFFQLLLKSFSFPLFVKVTSADGHSADLLTSYDSNMKSKLLEVTTVRRRLDKLLQKQCSWSAWLVIFCCGSL